MSLKCESMTVRFERFLSFFGHFNDLLKDVAHIAQIKRLEHSNSKILMTDNKNDRFQRKSWKYPLKNYF